MKNLFSSLSYQLFRNGIIYRTIILFAITLGIFGFVLGKTSDTVPSAGRLVTDSPSILWMFQSMMISMLTASICAEGFKDKDLYNELMSGHSRAALYFSKAIPSTVLTALLATVLAFIPVGVNYLFFGWGELIEPSGTILRIALFFFPFLRMASFFVLIAFLLKRSLPCVVIGYFSMCMGMFLDSSMVKRGSFLISFFNLKDLCDYSTWEIYSIDPAKGVVQHFAYDSSLSGEMIVGTIGASLIVSCIYLLAGYGFFSRDDLN